MKPLFIKKNGTVSKVSGIIMNLIPSYTLAEYNALTHKPLLWVRTDEEYAQIPSTDVSYGSGSVKDALDDLNTAVDLCECLVVSATSVNSLPVTINNENITSDMVVINSVVNNVSAQLSDWSWETANGSITLSGTIKGTTNIMLYLVKSR